MIQCVIYKGESQDYTEKKDFNLAGLILELEFLFQWKFVQEICILFVQEMCAHIIQLELICSGNLHVIHSK